VTAGDQVNELHLIVAGQATVERCASADVITEGLLLVVDGLGPSSGAAQPVVLGPGDSAGEMAFFTEMPCLEVRG
jgi:CRP-like cAMP-binding protein